MKKVKSGGIEFDALEDHELTDDMRMLKNTRVLRRGWMDKPISINKHGLYLLLNKNGLLARLLIPVWPRTERGVFGNWQIEQARVGTDTTNFYHFIGFRY